jgi:MFS family permease
MQLDVSPAAAKPSLETGPWYKGLNRYQWFVLVVAALGWLFDCLDQQLFILARIHAMKDLLPDATAEEVNRYKDYATSIFLIGWASGGLLLGVLGDRIGRARTMLIAILLYSLFTGLSSFSVGFYDFALYRFLTGLGVGGEFAVGVALVAEVMPDRARPYALGMLQALSAVGNISAALIGMALGALRHEGYLGNVWRPMFIIGAVPALLVFVIFRHLKEPERWQHASHTGAAARQLGSYRALFGNPLLRKHALLGLALAFAGVVGLWAIGFYTMDLVAFVLRPRFASEGISGQELEGSVTFWQGITSMMLNLGAFLGMYSFGIVTQRLGRKQTFALAFIAAGLSTAAVFAFLSELHQIFWLVPFMGFCLLSLFAGYAIYLPELFPTSLRSTGTSFCYNVGRFVAAVGPALLGLLTLAYKDPAEPMDLVKPLRYAGLTMCLVFVIGLASLPFLPETKGKPLPE